MSKRPNRKNVIAYLKKNRLMALGTTKGDRPWVATVFFAHDDDGNILFYSRTDTRHSKNIKANPRVSIVIHHDWKYSDGSIKGFQAAGHAAQVPKKDLLRLYAIYKSRFPWADDFSSDHVLYRVRLEEIWLIDEKIFGHFFRLKVIS